jgi:alpha-maltose-1-phosphate synthase
MTSLDDASGPEIEWPGESAGKRRDRLGPATRRTRLVFLNENIGGHTTVHLSIADALKDHDAFEARFVDIPSPRLLRRVVSAQLPGLARLDLDLQPLRNQLAGATIARRRLRPLLNRADALHVYTQNAALLSVGLLRRVPTVVSIDSTNVRNAFVLPYRYPTRFTSKTLPITVWFERRVFEQATLVVASSRWICSSLTGDYQLPMEKIRVVPFGITVPTKLPADERHDPPRITFVGRSLERKGGRLLLQLHQLHLRERCTLTLVTQDRVERGLQGVEVRNDVTPGDAKLDSILAATDVFVLPSHMDQSPNAVLEAMAAGLPVVAMAVAGVPEMVEHGETGLLVTPGDDHALVTAISSLLDDPQRARAMGERGRQRVLERFDARRTTARLLEVIGEAIALHRPDQPADAI